MTGKQYVKRQRSVRCGYSSFLFTDAPWEGAQIVQKFSHPEPEFQLRRRLEIYPLHCPFFV